MLSIIKECYDNFTNYLNNDAQICDEKIESYTNINIGDNHIPKIDDDVILCIPLKNVDELNVYRKPPLYLKHRVSDKYPNLYVKGGVNYEIYEELSEQNIVKKICNPFNSTDLTGILNEIVETNYFFKIDNIQSCFGKNFRVKEGTLLYIDYNRYMSRIWISMYDKNDNNVHNTWQFNFSDISDKKIWIAYGKQINSIKSARK